MSQDQLIRQRAHALWEQQGRPDGKAEDHWRQASAEIASDAPRPKRAAAAATAPAKQRTATTKVAAKKPAAAKPVAAKPTGKKKD